MNNIYEMLNDIEVDLSEYNVCELNDIEKKRMKINIKKKLNTASFNFRGIVAKAAILLIVVLISTTMGNGVLASISNIIRTGIEELFQYSSNTLEDYKTVINKEVTRNGVTVKLDEVILDDDQILISSTFSTDKIKWDQSAFVETEVYINGKDIMSNGGGGGSYTKIINNSTASIISSISPGNTTLLGLTGNFNIKVVYNNIRIRDSEVKGKWVFEFTASKDRLLADIKEIPINVAFAADNGPQIIVESLRISPVATKLNYTQAGDLLKYHVSFILTDQDGKEIKWHSGNLFNGSGTEMYDALNVSTTKLYITPVLKAFSQPKEGNGEEAEIYRKVLNDQTFEIMIN